MPARPQLAVLLASILCACSNAAAQEVGAGEVRGEIQSESAGIFHGSAELHDLRSHRRLATADIAPDGTFILRNVPPGDYEITILGDHNESLYQGLVSVDSRNWPLIVRLPAHETVQPPSGSVSVSELLHPP
ncbi:MAG TPA: hypothetical protein VLY04_03915 [Bryobacteraceae bacterium]|nr:hypothetical protein [Bryobacteraceae bacterium]